MISGKDVSFLSEFSSNFDFSKLRIAIAVSHWNNNITDSLFNGAFDTLVSTGLTKGNIDKFEVPGSFELVYAANKLNKKNDYNAIICIGSIIKGETKHFEYVCNAVSSGISYINSASNTPVIFCVLTDDNYQQALDRAGGKYGNKGSECAIAAVKMAILDIERLS